MAGVGQMHVGFDIARVSWDNFPTLDTFLDEEEGAAIPNSLVPGKPSRLEHETKESVAVVEAALVVLEIVVVTAAAAAETVALAAETALVVVAAETVEIAGIVAVVVMVAVVVAKDEGYNLLQDAVQDLVASAH